MKFTSIFLIFLAIFSLNAYAGTGNETNDTLQTLSTADQAQILGTAVGNGCIGQVPYYMGVVTVPGPELNNALWSIKCASGLSYVVKLLPDQAGSTRTVDCNEFKEKTGLSCFEKL